MSIHCHSVELFILEMDTIDNFYTTTILIAILRQIFMPRADYYVTVLILTADICNKKYAAIFWNVIS